MPNGVGGEKAATPLREAKASHNAALRSRAVFWFFTMMTLFFTLVAVAAWPAALVVKMILLAMAVAPAVVAVRARARASAATADANGALDKAWLAAAEDVASHAKKGVTVAELASRLKIDAVKAEHLLTQLAVHDRTRIDVDEDAEVRYSVAPDVDTSKVRISTSEEQFRALEQAEAAAAADAEAEAEGAERADDTGGRRLTAEQEALEAKKLATSPFGRGPTR
jgi:SWI/SNF-related matrix-associated actin-dependent regulator 1 of chromatin subfamily A